MKKIKQVGVLLSTALLVFIFLLVKCKTNHSPYLGKMSVPSDNPQAQDKIAFGKLLFFDKRLSADNSVSCASCHNPKKAFTDGKKISSGIHGRLAMRNAPTLLNVGYNSTLMFDGEIKTLEIQALVPLRDSSEMANDLKKLTKKLRKIPEYEKQAQAIFKRSIDPYVITRSLAAFQRSLLSENTPFDRFYKGNSSAISADAKKGYELFANKLYCTACHLPPHFTNFKTENNGLYADYTWIEDKGRYRINDDSTEIGNFKVPTLRNIYKTAPYMHDGSFSTIDDVLNFYMKGGNKHPNQNRSIVEFELNTKERKQLKSFLKSLSDDK